MKKILYYLFAVLALSCSFISCSDDDDDATIHSVTPEKAAAGVYSGTFTRVQDGTTDTLYTQGTVTITATDSAYCADVTYDCTGDFTFNATSVANISYAGNGFVFTNNSTSNGLGASFIGRISSEGTLSSYFKVQQKSGRKTYTYYYNFSGVKQ
ncbi:hypothetical protein [uncultured Prevotella sp.]|uniref:hypothetical protein n=1 Tax=uncultured Prevotella sp. TaxID=159272 RepID=UPI0025D6C494|nr:hypothetical protein [uncultured Prevotella sp.]